ncbi:MAG: SDR family oxidoreductase [bacterium]|nr:SDR family oxidoreductase [bacterium]MCP5068075.1 SDR family oxidoreductase [bacterium]
MRRALVTGGAGFIGSHLTERLVAEGFEVRILDDFSSGRRGNLHEFRDAIELLEGDLRDSSLLARAVEGVEVVFHEAAVASVPTSVIEPERTNDVNLIGTLSLLEHARKAGVRRVVFAASSSAYGNAAVLPSVETLPPQPLSPYALQKVTGEQYCRLYTELYGLETVALRYFNVYGPRQDPESEYAAVIPRFIHASLERRPAQVYGDGEQTRDFIYVADVAEANLLAADSVAAVGKLVNIAGGRRISLNQLLTRLRELCGGNVQPVYQSARQGDVRDSHADTGLARELLGFDAQTPIETGLGLTLDHFRKVDAEGDTK